jgi:hypothetical protein
MLRLSITVFAALLLTACVMNQTKEVAYRTLFSDNGMPDAKAFTAALSVKFPPGTARNIFEKYIAANGGSCHAQESAHLWCEFATRVRPCEAQMLGIDVTLEGGAIGTLLVKAGGLGC